MKAAVILPILGALVLIGIASVTFTNDRITGVQRTQKEDVVRIEETQKKHIEQIAVVETKIDNVQRTLNRIERVLNRSCDTDDPDGE